MANGLTPNQIKRAEKLIEQARADAAGAALDMAFAGVDEQEAVWATQYLLHCDEATAAEHLAFARGENPNDLIFVE